MDLAVAAAHKLWINEEDKRTKEIIQLSLKQVHDKHSLVLKKLISEREELIQQLKETNKLKLLQEQELKIIKGKLKKGFMLYSHTTTICLVTRKSTSLENVMKELNQSLPTLQTELVNLVCIMLCCV